MKGFLVHIAVLTLLTGCGTAPPVIPAKDMSARAEAQLRAQNPDTVPGAMKCPALRGEVGLKIRCLRSVHIGIWNTTIKGTVTVTKVEGRTVTFGLTMDDHIATYAADRRTNEGIVADGLKVDRKSISCPKPISGKVGSVGYCVVTDSDGVPHRVRLTVASSDLNAGSVEYSMRVID